MRIAYLDCFAGISGDMLLGALVDAGVPRSVLEEATSALALGATLRFETVDRSGVSATKVHVLEDGVLADDPASAEPFLSAGATDFAEQPTPHAVVGHAHPHVRPEAVALLPGEPRQVQVRSLTEIRRLIGEAALRDEVKALALQVFDLLGHSEAKIHNVPVDEVHFHEVGAVDALVDIVAAAAGIVHLNVDCWYGSPVNVGGGFVRCAHGVFPVPAPATADLLRGYPTYSQHVQKELVTPTGAAFLRALAPEAGPQPAMAVEHIGYGAGTRNPPGFPNVLRICVGQSHSHVSAVPAVPPQVFARDHSAAQTVAVLETALDDASPQLLAYVAEQALHLGALDVMLTPVLMKKGRPGILVTLLARPEDVERFEEMLLRETTTLGVRVREDRRVCLERAHTAVDTPYGAIRVKTGSRDGQTLNANPEFEDCRRAAEEQGIPLKQVQTAALVAYARRMEEGSKP